MSGRVALVLGRRPSAGSVLHDVGTLLGVAGVEVAVAVVPDRGQLPRAVHSGDLLVHKDLSPSVLRQLVRDPSLRCCDDPSAVLRTVDKAAVVARLRTAGVRGPGTRTARTWEQVRTLAADRRGLVVKPRTGTSGQGVLLLDGEAPPLPPSRGPWLVQDRIGGDGVDRKLYVVGDRVSGVLRRWPAPEDRSGTPFAPSAELTEVARSAATALGLEVCGIDVVAASDGPVVVDVNPFPGFKGVPGAAESLAAHVARRLARLEVSACAS